MKNRIGSNGKTYKVRKDGYLKLKFEDIVQDGFIKQSMLRRIKFDNAIAKEYKVLRELIIQALHLGYKQDGVLMASICPVTPKKVFNVKALSIFLSKHGRTIEDFQIDGKEGERLNVE